MEELRKNIENNYYYPCVVLDKLKEVKDMTCDYFEYRRMMDKLFYGIPLTDNRLNEATEIIRQYLVKGGAGNILKELGVGIRIVTKECVFLPPEIIRKRFVWLKGQRKGEELDRSEIESIGMFLKHGAIYRRCDVF